MKIKHILVTTELEYPHQGGVSSHIELLIKGMKQVESCEVSVISRKDISRLSERLCFLLSGFVSLFNKGLGYLLYHKLIGLILRLKIDSFVAKNNVDIIHIHSTNFAFSKGFAVPSVLTCHADITNEMLGQHKLKHDSYAEKQFIKMEYDCYMNNRHIIAVDERLKKHVLSIAPKSKVSSMINFIDPYEFDNIFLSNEDKIKFKIPDDKRILLCPRRMVIKNGVIYAVKMLETLPYDFHLVIVGGGEEHAHINEYAAKHGLLERISIIPGVNRDEMAQFYNLAEFVIVPSITVNNLQEATSISALEGMACGKVVVASAIGGLVLLINDGKDGLLFNETNSSEGATKISELSAEKIKLIGKNAREKVINNFGYISACQKINTIYKSLL
ncbi:glycosyltransferase family 4 protein [Photobacterium damselae]|uniref:glycosyltransferase family 4 protein n=1 Tax=Photobacterium damselae TaxID=38293 RepID=UPI00165E7118|nr:glycosyltransferase family 4 protein [Photobacterium damselae]